MGTLSLSKYNTKGRNKYAFIEFPSAKIYKRATGSSWNNHLLFGDYIKILNENIVDGRVYVRSRNTNGWISVTDLRKDRILEINFVDIGQGDGCHLVTPDDQHIIIDAGKTDNMIRYLTWRFNLNNRATRLNIPIDIIISHSDADHYQGFSYIFDEEKIQIRNVFHNGLVERPGSNRLGEKKDGYITGIVNNTNQMKEIIQNPSNRKGTGSLYCKTLFKSLKNNNDISFKALSINDNYIPSFNSQNIINNKEFSIKILAPITDLIEGVKGLKSIDNLGKDKNWTFSSSKITIWKFKNIIGRRCERGIWKYHP